MSGKSTHLLRDDPASADEFGTHNKIAALLSDEILHSAEGRSIALVGDWGSGKSTIVELLKGFLINKKSSLTHVFIYDAWSHQGDSLRRAFLDDFINSLKDKLFESEAKDASDKVWNRTETTTTTKEPILRPHAKILLFCIALLPLGFELFNLRPNFGLLEELTQCRNIASYPFLLAPILAVTLLGFINSTNWTRAKDLLFGDSHKNPDFSVLHFFFEKVQGDVERKHIKTPVDSIRAFRDVFSQILDDVQARDKELRIIIIIDNIDRIPPDQARDFWSTMQTFFGDSGGLRKPLAKKYWLVAPFSVEALSFIFRDGISNRNPTADIQTEAKAKAKAYIDKTFGLTLYVPPPILTNWRKYLLAKLKEAFPEHSEGDLISVRDVFDFTRSGATITPREMKLFVNSLVVIYRQRGDEIHLPIMAVYILHRDKITGTAIRDDLLKPRERRLIDDPDWRIPITALHFGVSPDQATQLLLQEPILSALREGSKDKLRTLEGRLGFADVLRSIADAELDSPEAENGTTIAQFAATIGALEGASKPELIGVWRDIRGRLKSVKGWNGMQSSPAEGISIILSHTSGDEKDILCNAIANSLSKAGLADPTDDFQQPNKIAANWLSAAVALANGAGQEREFRISFPGAFKLKIELLQQLAEANITNDVKVIFALDLTAEELSKALAAEIAQGRFPRIQAGLVSLLTATMKINVPWQNIVSACTERLRVTTIGAKETEALTGLLTVVGTIGSFAGAFNALKELSVQGYLSHLLQQHQKSATASANLIAAIMLTNPSFDRSNQLEQSQPGDTIFNGLADAAEFNHDQISNVAKVIEHARAGSTLFAVGAQNQKIARLSAAIIGEITQQSYRFSIEPKVVVDYRSFLEQNSNLNPIASFLENLVKRDGVLSLLSEQPFGVDRAQFYGAALGISHNERASSYLSYLQNGILALDKGEWEKALNAGKGPHFELLELASGLRKVLPDFELSTPSRDAALDHVRKAGQAKTVPTEELRNRLTKLLELLPVSLRSSLIRDIVDDMVGLTDPAQIMRIVEIAGNHVTLEDENDPDRIVRRIFSPLAGNPTERTAAWMASTVSSKLEFFRQLPAETKNELGWRLKTALQGKEASNSTVTESLTNMAGLLGIDLTRSEEVTSESSTKTEEP